MAKRLFRRTEPTKPISGMYDPEHYLITSVHVPTIVQIVAASDAKPCLGLRLTIDLREVSKLMVHSNLSAPSAQPPGRGMAIGQVTTLLLDAFTRLIDLLANEADISILAPVIQREIAYCLLVGDQGAHLRQKSA